MRYVGILIVIISIPAFYLWLRSSRKNYPYAYFALGLLPFVQTAVNLDASLWNIGGLGYAKGLVLTLLDTLCLAILATSRFRIIRLPFSGLFVAYILATFVSVFQAPGFFESFSYTFQLLRAFLVFVTVATVVQQSGALRYVANGLAVGAMIQGIVAITQRLGGDFQAGGTMGHQNLAGMALHFATLPLLAMLLAGEKSKLYTGGVAGGLAAVALGASRGSIAALAVGLAILVFCSLVRQASARKFGVVGVLVLMVLAASPVLYEGLAKRFSSVTEVTTVDEEREAFKRAAQAMFADHPMGVGANRYTFVGITEGYSARAGVTWAGASRTAVVHNLYWLTAAELGWLGLLTLPLLLICVILRGFLFAFSRRRDPRGDVVLGFTCAIAVTAWQSFYEWVFVLSAMNYMFAIALGVIAGSIVQRKHDSTMSRRRSLPAPAIKASPHPALAKAGSSRAR